MGGGGPGDPPKKLFSPALRFLSSLNVNLEKKPENAILGIGEADSGGKSPEGELWAAPGETGQK